MRHEVSENGFFLPSMRNRIPTQYINYDMDCIICHHVTCMQYLFRTFSSSDKIIATTMRNWCMMAYTGQFMCTGNLC